jgi:hypothetical protein
MNFKIRVNFKIIRSEVCGLLYLSFAGMVRDLNDKPRLNKTSFFLLYSFKKEA